MESMSPCASHILLPIEKIKERKKGKEYNVIRGVPMSTKQLIKKQKRIRTTEYLSPVRDRKSVV